MFRFPLPVPQSTSYARLGVGPEATAEEILVASDGYVARLKACGANEDSLAEANVLKSLARTEERTRYDDEHPPLGLLSLEVTWSSLFDSRTEGLAVIRREVETFLASRDVAVYFPTDLTRTDFTDDFAFSPILDGNAGS